MSTHQAKSDDITDIDFIIYGISKTVSFPGSLGNLDLVKKSYYLFVQCVSVKPCHHTMLALTLLENLLESPMPKWRGRDHHQPFLSIYQPWTLVVGQQTLPRSFFFFSSWLASSPLSFFPLILLRKDADSFDPALYPSFQQVIYHIRAATSF